MNKVGTWPQSDSLLFFRWTRPAPAEHAVHGLVNNIHRFLLHLGLQNNIEPGKAGHVLSRHVLSSCTFNGHK